MKKFAAALACLVFLGLGCAHAAGPDDMQGMYRAIWNDGEKNDTVFGIARNLAGEWMLTDGDGVFQDRLWEAWHSEVVGALGAPVAEKSFCLASYDTVVDFFCATVPGIPTRFVSHDFFSQSHDFITKTDHLVYLAMSGIFNLEKVADFPPVPPLDDAGLLAQAESGDAEARYAVGEYYFVHIRAGDAASEAARLAAQWLGKSAAQGNTDALVALAYLHENGGGKWRDPEKARAYYQAAADKGSVYAMTSLGDMLLGGSADPADPAGPAGPAAEETGVRWYIKAAEQGDYTARLKLLRLYASGRGVPRDEAKAREWAGKVLESDGGPRSRAMYYLGQMYAGGDGVPPHPEKAVYWMREAAREDSSRAMTALAGYYAKGLGTMPSDPVQAVAWLRRAKPLGIDRDALRELETLEAGLTETQRLRAEEAAQRIEADFGETGIREQEPR